MRTLLRIVAPMLAIGLLLVPAQAAVAKKRSYNKIGQRTLHKGSKGKDVKVLQKYLTQAGHEAEADGMYGTGTVTAVKAFEAAQKRTVDGRFSRSDAAALRDVVANGSAIGSSADTGGIAPPSEEQVNRTQPGAKATVGSDGLAVAPASAPAPVKAIIAAGNRIATKPYVYGGGHGKWEDTGYDCSGSVSYALHGANLLDQPLASGGFERWADAGAGQWVTTYANGGHMYMVVAGLRFDTSGRTKNGTRWQADMRSTSGYSVRHPTGL